MDWYLAVLKKYATFDGRARRKEYWMFVLFNLLIAFLLAFIEAMLGIAPDSDTSVLVNLYYLAVLIPTLAVSVRRLHDTDRSGWWLLLALVPLANIALLVFFIQEGTRGSNQYGPDPKTATGLLSASTAPAGWLPDPTGRHELRYWDAAQWTNHVSDKGVAGVDPL